VEKAGVARLVSHQQVKELHIKEEGWVAEGFSLRGGEVQKKEIQINPVGGTPSLAEMTLFKCFQT
jgi:hypothetical protein